MLDSLVRGGRWWHLLIIGTALLNAVIAGSLAVGAVSTLERTEAIIATVALLLIPVVWLLFGVESLRSLRRGTTLVAIITLLVTVAMVLVPWTGFVQTLVYPLVWCVFLRPRVSIAVSIGIALGIGAVSALYNGVEEIPDILPGQLFSIAATCGIGFAITYAWRIAEERSELVEQLTASQEHVRELSRLSGASVERERISRDLHDTLAQTLAGLAMLADRSAKEISRMRDDQAASSIEAQEALLEQKERADLIASLARDALAEARGLIAENAPVRADQEPEVTFASALARLVERFRRETGVAAEQRIDLPVGLLDREREVVLLRCAQEALSNARRHASASNVRVSVEAVPRDVRRPSSVDADHGLAGEAATERDELQTSGLESQQVVLCVSDDGRGFDRDAAASGYGLESLRDRAGALDGTVDIESAPTCGTIVTVTIPTMIRAAR